MFTKRFVINLIVTVVVLAEVAATGYRLYELSKVYRQAGNICEKSASQIIVQQRSGLFPQVHENWFEAYDACMSENLSDFTSYVIDLDKWTLEEIHPKVVTLLKRSLMNDRKFYLRKKEDYIDLESLSQNEEH
ncbi:hypothetical protein [Vibrio sp. SCSIO 43137]|uniref:hypothetical protein n=1 Tax=Vibrio sp. SCSIO 43137 TaxID=3021011 RepID=UPI002307F697|nr:hypothetical protein [Vibrio sp. SCSIO 43137]WCE28819.1 hypothetical protein PK654_10660 [Vibrio sp. SCSIO 43137]